jgi:hypothetical protein
MITKKLVDMLIMIGSELKLGLKTDKILKKKLSSYK